MGRTLAKATNAVTFCQEGAPVDDARIATTDGLAAYNDEKTGRRNVQHQIAEFQALERELSELILTTDAVARAKQLVREIPGSIMLDQFSNPANPKIHRRMTVLEIWDDTGGAVDVFISAVGTGGTITGVGEVLKERKPAVRVIAIEPAGAAVLSGGPAGKHLMPGIGVGFIPEVLNRSIRDEIIVVTDEEAFDCARRLAREEGIVAGGSLVQRFTRLRLRCPGEALVQSRKPLATKV